MAIKKYAKLEEIPEAQRGDAIELKGGEFIVNEPDDNSALTTALETERKKREAAEGSASKVAASLKKLEDKLKAQEGGITEEKLNQIRADVKKELEEEYGPKLKSLDDLRSENRSMKLDSKVQELAVAAGFLPERLKDFWKLHGDEFDLTDDGKPMVKDKPGTDVAKHVAAIAKTRSEWVKGTQGDGGGTGGTVTKPGPKGTGPTPEEIIKNPGLALQQARAAGKTE